MRMRTRSEVLNCFIKRLDLIGGAVFKLLQTIKLLHQFRCKAVERFLIGMTVRLLRYRSNLTLNYRCDLLFLCSQNKRRSLTAEKLFDGQNGHQARSAGTENNARIKLSPGLVGWADIIFCMEKTHVWRLKEKYSDIIADKTFICLNIPDDYSYKDDDLCELFESVVPEYL